MKGPVVRGGLQFMGVLPVDERLCLRGGRCQLVLIHLHSNAHVDVGGDDDDHHRESRVEVHLQVKPDGGDDDEHAHDRRVCKVLDNGVRVFVDKRDSETVQRLEEDEGEGEKAVAFEEALLRLCGSEEVAAHAGDHAKGVEQRILQVDGHVKALDDELVPYRGDGGDGGGDGEKDVSGGLEDRQALLHVVLDDGDGAALNEHAAPL
mmetsp:Transcript_25601/g.69279  ORF Transcript_25601/g.69279 Transcript_25601/m.69279 type:complete len:206 (+) Transcript_25601:225-842(+)